MSITQGTVTTAGADVYTSSGATAITAAFIMNNHSGSVVIEIHVVKDGASAAATNKIIKNLTIAAADSYVLDTEKLLLDDGDSLHISADVDSVVYTTVSHIGV